MWELEKWYRWTYFQHRNRDTGHTETRGEGVSGMDWEIRTDIHALPCYHRKPVGSFYVAPGAQLHALWWPRGLGWRGGRFRRKVVHVCISLVHSIVQQKPVQHGKEIILQFLKMHANFMFYSKEEEKKNVAEEWKLWKQQWPWGNLTNKGKRTQGCPHLLLGLGKRPHVKAEEDGKENPEGRLQQRLPVPAVRGIWKRMDSWSWPSVTWGR